MISHGIQTILIESLDTPGPPPGIEGKKTDPSLEHNVLSSVTDELREFRAPQTMTTEELGDSLARLVWESFTDYLAHEDVETPLPDSATPDESDAADPHAEEALIFFMWAHTRGAQLAFHGRRAVFEDMVAHGTPHAQLPIFEQRVGARYSEYNLAASESDGRLGEAVSRHLTGDPKECREIATAITERAIAVANPLRDFLEEVELVD
jgi:hypothetical protein